MLNTLLFLISHWNRRVSLHEQILEMQTYCHLQNIVGRENIIFRKKCLEKEVEVAGTELWRWQSQRKDWRNDSIYEHCLLKGIWDGKNKKAESYSLSQIKNLKKKDFSNTEYQIFNANYLVFLLKFITSSTFKIFWGISQEPHMFRLWGKIQRKELRPRSTDTAAGATRMSGERNTEARGDWNNIMVWGICRISRKDFRLFYRTGHGIRIQAYLHPDLNRWGDPAGA